MKLGLATRILLAGGIVVVFLLVEFVFVIHAFNRVRHFTRQEQQAQLSVVAASQVEKLILDLESGSRGYVITLDPRFLEPWRSAQTQLPGRSRELLALDPGPGTAAIVHGWQSYLELWSKPLVRLTRTDPSGARLRITTGAGKRLVDRLRALIDPYISEQGAVASIARAHVVDEERGGVVVGAAGVGITALLFVLIVSYFLRAAVFPLRKIAEATRQVADGRIGVVVPEGGAGEVGALAASFNEMSQSLSRSSNELAQQNLDLERLANVLRGVLDSTVDGILLSDADGNVQLANRPVVKLTRELGMSFDGTVVDRLLSLQHRIKDGEKYAAAMERLRGNPNESTFDEFEDTVSSRVFHGVTAPVYDDRGGFLGRIWTLRDVTQQRELDRLKDDFVATVSHELRTPLTSMMGFLEMIREGEAGELNEEQQRFLAIVYRSSERLQRLVGDLLFVARLDANGLQLRFSDARLDDIARECVEGTAALARSREIHLEAEIDGVPTVWGDPERLAQLVGNLVSNAIKFTPAGGRVVLRTRVDGPDALVEVEDTGIGIPEAEQGRLFERFFRSSTATEQAIPGTGLGLVISQAIATAHGGRITVRSSSGNGTCFSVRIPLVRQEVAV